MRKGRTIKKIGNSKYKCVYEYATDCKNTVWLGKVGKKQKNFDTERDAALFVDKKLIEQGKKPVNILVAK